MISFDIMALDASFDIVAFLKYTNVQWSRKYHECGTFSIQIPLEQYNPSFEYIYTKSRPEVGKITQINYVGAASYRYIQLSGYFLENELNRMVAYAKGTGNILSSPAWAEKIGYAENVAYDFFNAFSSITFNDGTEDVEYSIGITPETSEGRGRRVHHVRENSYLGDKIYHILKSSGLSYRVVYDFVDNTKAFVVWGGLDRSADQTDNNPVVFSTRYGNIRKPNVLIDSSTYKSGSIVINKSTTDNDDITVYVRANINPAETDNDNAFLSFESTANASDFSALEDLYVAMDAEGVSEKEAHWIRTLNLEFDTLPGSYVYMEDFDLGDVCSIEIDELGLSVDARLIGCYEVVKSGEWTLSMEFGTPILKR